MDFAFGPATPIVRVADLAASIAYYVDVLGFRIDWQAPPLVSVSRDRCCLFLSQGDQGHPGGWIWTGVNDVKALHEDLRGRGARIRQAPTNFQWALEIQVADPDGNVLRFGSDPLKGVPFGPWLDMEGVLWNLEDGRWVRNREQRIPNPRP
jgi:catechol 2,3-dioxygenase-like lactoylglutathione lyase family enzyme